MGGDEFIIIIYEKNVLEIKKMIKQINIKLYKYNLKFDKPYEIMISVGYKEFNNNYSQINDYIKDIDDLMYRNKYRMKKS